MRLGCPNCAAEYEVPDSLLASGPRVLRCARCGHQFEAALPAPAVSAAADLPAAPEPSPFAGLVPDPPPAAPPPPPPAAPALVADTDRPPPTRGPTRHSPIDAAPAPESAAPPGRGILLAGWAVSLGVVAAAGWAMLHFQAAIVAAWPPAARLYLALGLG